MPVLNRFAREILALPLQDCVSSVGELGLAQTIHTRGKSCYPHFNLRKINDR